MIVTFKNADRDYATWLEHHPNGYVLNPREGGQQPMLHRAGCIHIEHGDDYRITERVKVCSDHRADVEAWARENGHGQVVPCSDCRFES